jgi:hypothetical protein
MTTVLASLEADLLALAAEGSLKVNTTAVQQAMRVLAETIDHIDTDPRDRALCLRELRAAFEDIVTETSGAAYAEWIARVHAS